MALAGKRVLRDAVRDTSAPSPRGELTILSPPPLFSLNEGIAVIAVVVALVVVLAAVVVRQRKSMQQRKISFGSSQSLDSASSGKEAAPFFLLWMLAACFPFAHLKKCFYIDDGLMKTTRRRHPIQVRSQDMDTFGMLRHAA
jgi:hypothetical protein